MWMIVLINHSKEIAKIVDFLLYGNKKYLKKGIENKFVNFVLVTDKFCRLL
jgi:enolase